MRSSDLAVLKDQQLSRVCKMQVKIPTKSVVYLLFSTITAKPLKLRNAKPLLNWPHIYPYVIFISPKYGQMHNMFMSTQIINLYHLFQFITSYHMMFA